MECESFYFKQAQLRLFSLHVRSFVHNIDIVIVIFVSIYTVASFRAIGLADEFNSFWW